MRWLGALLVLAGAGGGYLLARRESLLPERLARALLVDLGPEGLRGVEERPFAPLRDLRTVRGTLQALTAPECYSEDYVYAAFLAFAVSHSDARAGKCYYEKRKGNNS